MLNTYRVYYIHQSGVEEGEKLFKKEKDAQLYARKLLGVESSDICLMGWNEQKTYLEGILDMSIECSESEFQMYIEQIGISEEEIKTKVDTSEYLCHAGVCAVIEGPLSSTTCYKLGLAFDFKHGLHYVLFEY
jgi:hypothetical protein